MAMALFSSFFVGFFRTDLIHRQKRLVCEGLAGLGLAGLELARLGLAGLGLARLGLAGLERICNLIFIEDIFRDYGDQPLNPFT